MVQAFPTTYDLGDFSEANTTAVADQFTTIYEKQVDKGEAAGLGRGTAQNQTDAEGRLYGSFEQSGDGAGNDGNAINEGVLRFAVRTRQGRLVAVINEYQLSEIQAGAAAADRGDRYPFAIQRFMAGGDARRWVGYPYVLTIEMKLTDAYDVDTADSELKADGKRAEATG
jgi:hypothetical protein